MVVASEPPPVSPCTDRCLVEIDGWERTATRYEEVLAELVQLGRPPRLARRW